MTRTNLTRTNLIQSTSRARLGFVAASVGLALSASLAAAQDADDAPLRGPKVVDREGEPGRFGPGPNANRQQAQRSQRWQQADQMMVWGRMLRVLGSDRAPEAVRLTEAQQDVIRPIFEAHGKELSAYYTAHKGKLVEAAELLGNEQLIARLNQAETIDARQVQAMGDQLRTRTRARLAERGADRAGNRSGSRSPEAMDGMDAMEQDNDGQRARRSARPQLSEEQRQGMRMLAELRQGAPSGDMALTKIKATLTDGQREFVEQRLARAQQAQAERARAERGQAERQAGRPQMGAGEPRRGRAESRRQPAGIKSQKLAEVLESMTKEEQDQLAELIERRRQARESGDQPRRRRGV